MSELSRGQTTCFLTAERLGPAPRSGRNSELVLVKEAVLDEVPRRVSYAKHSESAHFFVLTWSLRM